MSGSLRTEVLKTFKTLHRTRLTTFKNDEKALQVIRKKINDEYRKNMTVADREIILELNKCAKAIEEEVRTKIIQAVETEPGKFEARIREENLVDNAAIPSPSAFCCDLSTKECVVPPKKNR
ncbi:complex III assembly factor LYRM7-like [Belonocnema kinseyi]|uniref:complex III assembly factor LYRM7-like n=1 Tax=Belonocnema kinseyi TaxID=2817044 RepID=UPI00143CEC23|nr:complex III assembly factor LYRM7-like [Belonocnema kinseyi]